MVTEMLDNLFYKSNYRYFYVKYNYLVRIRNHLIVHLGSLSTQYLAKKKKLRKIIKYSIDLKHFLPINISIK